MKMEFIIDDEKCKKEGFEKQQCLEIIKKHFAKYNKRGTIKEIQNGVFEGEESDLIAFGSTFCLTSTNWFLKVIRQWNWYTDGEKIDCIKKHYEVVVRNA